jgi:hypothetical protein
MYLKTSTAKVSSMTVPVTDKAEAFSVRGSGPQGLRRPRFSFFRFTCQTARNLAAPSSLFLPGKSRSNENPLIRRGDANMAIKSMAGCSVTV